MLYAFPQSSSPLQYTYFEGISKHFFNAHMNFKKVDLNAEFHVYFVLHNT